ncbi:hypothetical protein MASR2M78_28120 [Treponema sp.]
MKRLLAACIMACVIGFPLIAGELTSSFSFTNLLFDADQTAPLQLSATPFTAHNGFGFGLGYKEKINDLASFDVSLQKTALLRNQVFTRLVFVTPFASISIGPYFAPFNTSGEALGSGISSLLRLEKPGLAFISLGADASIGSALSVRGDYIQEHSSIEAGFWLPNVLASFRVSTDSFSEKQKDDRVVVDECSRYELITDVFKKNVPYTVRINVGYEELSRSYASSTGSLSDSLGLVLMGMEVSFQPRSDMKIRVGGESPLYAWGIGDLGSPSSNTVFLELHAALQWTLPSKL